MQYMTDEFFYYEICLLFFQTGMGLLSMLFLLEM